MDKKEEIGIVCVLLLFAALFCFIGYTVGHSRASEQTKQEAVNSHAASWECNQKDGTRHIKWHSCPLHHRDDD